MRPSGAIYNSELKEFVLPYDEVQEQDLIPAEARVRAQALVTDGRLVEDFLIVRAENSIHVCNAPSPAATSSLLIGQHIARQALS